VSQVKVFTVSADTTVRTHLDGTSGEGCGLSKHLYVGIGGTGSGARRYTSFFKLNYDWANVRKIISATLNMYTDEYNLFGPAGEIGIMGQPGPTDKPHVGCYRLTSAFTVGNNTDGQFNSSDYTNPSHTTSLAVGKDMLPLGADLLNTLDITALVRMHAPATVEGGGKATNYGFGLYGTGDNTRNWSGWSSKHAGGGGPAERMTVTLVYELGPTPPNTPGPALFPAGAIASLDTFEGDFSDIKAGDTLQSTSIEIYDAGLSGAGSSVTDQLNFTAGTHPFLNGDQVYLTALTGGAGLSLFTRYYVRQRTSTTIKLATTNSDSTIVNITTTPTAHTLSRLVRSVVKVASNSERTSARSIVPKPSDFNPVPGIPYRWRMRQTDQEGQVSPWTALVSITLTNTPPNAPILSPVSGSSYASLNLVKFKGGTFSDPNSDRLMAHQVQLSPFPNGDVRWDEADGILWDTGKAYDPLGATSWTELYGGRALVAGTYYWRARHWDTRDGVSNWTYAQITLTADFSPDPASYDNVQIDPRAPWRILIRNLKQADGVTPTVGRAPGQLVAVFEEAKNVGASIVYNSPGELHFTLLKDDEQISVVEPKQTHYAVEFYSGDGWQEKFAGVVWDVDATETDVVFKGIDYLALYDTVIDERYDPLKPNKSYASGGSFYENITIRNIVVDQLNRAKALTDSWVGFISIGSIATMNEKATVYSTMQPVLSFVSGLIDSHRQGTGKRSRMKVVKTTAGGYQLQIVDDPGLIRSDLAMYYGELVQGYRIIVFGDGWANVQHVVGRNREGSKVVYQTISGKTFQPATSVYGRIATVSVMDGVQDQNDLTRRGLQAAIQSAKLGKNVAIGIRTEFLAPLQGWDVCDVFPLRIDDGAIDTDRFGSGYWAAYACAWEATDIGEQSLVITFLPREDATAPDADLIPSRPISTQPEWQLGWVPPNPLAAHQIALSHDTGYVMDAGLLMDAWLDTTTSNIYVDASTGYVYELNADGATWDLIAGPPTVFRPHDVTIGTRSTLNRDGTAVVNLSIGVTA
jgi:hypothetical protein